MSVTYREAKARVEALPPEERDAYLQRVWAYKHEVELAGMPWSVLTYAAYLAGVGLIMLAGELPGPDWAPLSAGVLVMLLGMPMQQVAVRRKRAYQDAHPFEA